MLSFREKLRLLRQNDTRPKRPVLLGGKKTWVQVDGKF